MATSLIVNKTTTAMKSNQKSIPNISDTASDYDCANFATHLIEDLSTDTVDGVYRVQKTDITDSTPTPQRQQATIALSETSTPVSAFNNGNKIIVPVNYDGDGDIYAYKLYDASATVQADTYIGFRYVDGTKLSIGAMFESVQPCTIYIKSTETDNYTAAETTFTITA